MGIRIVIPLIFNFIFAISVLANPINLDSLQNIAGQYSGKEKAKKLNEISRQLLNQDIAAAKVFAIQSVRFAEAINSRVALAEAKNNLGHVFLAKNDFTNAMKVFVEALKIQNELKNELGVANSKNNVGWVFYLQENYVQAEENFKESLELKERLKDAVGSSDVHRNLGDVYLAKKIYGKSLEHFRQALEIKLSLEDVSGASTIANHIGKISTDLGDYEGAIAYYQMSLDLHSSLENLPKIAEDNNNIALTLMAMKEYEEAMEVNNIALDLRKRLKDTLGFAESLKNKAQILTNQNKASEAKSVLDQTKGMLSILKPQPGSQLIYQKLSSIYGQLNLFQDAYQAHLNYSKQKDIIFNQEKSKALLDLTTKYESEFAAEEQQRTIELLEIENSNARKVRYFLFAVIGLIGLLFLSALLSYRQKQKDNQLLLAKNEEIKRQSDEIDGQNLKLEENNANLDVLNKKLVDEIAERESIEKSSFARDRFLATMSHEMRTPINIIIGLTHLLLDEDPRDDQIEHLRTLQFSANNLVVFINDVLDFSKIEAGKLELESRDFAPERIFKDIRDRFALPAEEKGVQIKYSFDRKIPDNLLGDPIRLNQIITNLVTASFNYTENGEIDVQLKLQELNKREATLMLQINDTGKGIEPEKIEEMFKSFAKNPGDIFEGYASSNLSLAITKRLVDLQNGKIEVDCREGVGNSFVVYLPYKLVAKQIRKSNEKEKSFNHLAGNSILLVEDNKINQLVVAKMLRRLNMNVITADDGLIALDKFEETAFDLILMDIQMPKMDGYRTTAEIRKHVDPTKRDIPIIALTASAFLTEKEKAKLFGMNDHVGKPFGPEELLAKISSCLEIHKMSS